MGSGRMKTGWERPYIAVCDNVEMAKFFIQKAEAAENGEHDIRLRWCLNIVAVGLFAAVDIFNKQVVEHGDKLSTRASDWFTENEELVNLLRHGALHFKQPHGTGESFAPGEKIPVKKFVWVEPDGSEPEMLPIEKVVSRLSAVAEQVQQVFMEKTGEWSIEFG